MTTIKTDRTTIKVYGEPISFENDSLFVIENKGKRYVKFKAYTTLYLVIE